jgi:hypothetical protein
MQCNDTATIQVNVWHGVCDVKELMKGQKQEKDLRISLPFDLNSKMDIDFRLSPWN